MSGNRAHPMPLVIHLQDRDSIFLSMDRQAHMPHDVSAWTRRIWPKGARYASQARADFCLMYKTWTGRSSEDDAGRLFHSEDMYRAMLALDKALFAGALTVDPLVGDGSALDYLDFGRNAHAGETWSNPRGDTLGGCRILPSGRVAIFVDAHHNGSPRTVKDMLETLVHEMAHAVFLAFACGCANCNATDPGVLGPYGNGPLWMGLVEAMRDEIRSWDRALGGFFTQDLTWHQNWEPPA